jgi:hypothetical protein
MNKSAPPVPAPWKSRPKNWASISKRSRRARLAAQHPSRGTLYGIHGITAELRKQRGAAKEDLVAASPLFHENYRIKWSKTVRSATISFRRHGF